MPVLIQHQKNVERFTKQTANRWNNITNPYPKVFVRGLRRIIRDKKATPSEILEACKMLFQVDPGVIAEVAKNKQTQPDSEKPASQAAVSKQSGGDDRNVEVAGSLLAQMLTK